MRLKEPSQLLSRIKLSYLLARGLGRWRLFQKCTKIFLLDLVQIQSHPGTAEKNKYINRLISIHRGDLVNKASDAKQHITKFKTTFSFMFHTILRPLLHYTRTNERSELRPQALPYSRNFLMSLSF